MTSSTTDDRAGAPDGPERLAPLRALVVTPTGTLGGSETWLLDLLRTSRARLRPEVWMLEDGPLRAALEADGVPVTVLPTGPRARDLALRNLDLGHRLHDSDAEVLLANGVKAAAAVVPAARAVGVPVVWAKHDFSWDRELAPRLGRMSDAVLATSASVAAATRRSDATIVPPPRPPAPASRAEAAAYWAEHGVDHGVASSEGPVLAVLGRLVGYKDVDTAIEALADDAARAWRLVVVGPDDPSEPGERTRLEALALRHGVADRVQLSGPVPDAGRHLAAFDAVAVLTRGDGDRFGREGYSLVALEALGAGVPLVGATGNPEVERMARAAGRVVPVSDPRAVAHALADLQDPEAREACGRAGRAVLADHPDASACAERAVQLLAHVARRPGPAWSDPR